MKWNIFERRLDRIAAHNRRVEDVTGPILRERFTIDVNQNLSGLGGAVARGQSTADMLLGYTVIVTDSATGVPQFVTQAPSYRMAYRVGEQHVQKIMTGKATVKLPMELQA